jgi:hypothetical protein
MASSSGSSPAFLRPRYNPVRLGCGLLAWSLLATLPALAEMPGYLRAALDRFNPGVPAGWACTLTTTRNDYTLVERFDPSRPAGGQWTLLQCQGRAPTAEEAEKYKKSRPPGSPVGPQANFQKGDIEPGSLTLVREDDERAEFKGAFRDESTGADKMLGHLVLHLTVSKQRPHIEKYALSLSAPYAPVLGVKMNELQVESAYRPPGTDRPALPATHTSRFSGRILLISTAETLQVTFSDFARTP